MVNREQTLYTSRERQNDRAGRGERERAREKEREKCRNIEKQELAERDLERDSVAKTEIGKGEKRLDRDRARALRDKDKQKEDER